MTLDEFKALNEENEASSLTCPRCGVTTKNGHAARSMACPRCQTRIRSGATFAMSLMSKSEARRCERGFLYVHELFDGMGRFLAVERAGNGGVLKLCSGSITLDSWHCDVLATAIIAASTWQPSKQREPFGWSFHPESRRKRPFGNPEAEYLVQSKGAAVGV